MADVDVSVNAVVKVCSASVQLQDVARRFSHGSGNQGLKQEYIQKYTQMQEALTSPLQSTEVVVTNGESTKLIDFNNVDTTALTEIKVADSTLLGIKCIDPAVAIIKSTEITNDSGTFSITVSDGAISSISFTPVTTP